MTVEIKQNKSGSITLIGKKSKVTLPKTRVELNNFFNFKLEELLEKCPKCKSKAFLKLGSTKVKGKIGVFLIHHLCLDCGYQEENQINKYEGYV
jgi:ribosomal protein L32